MAAQHIRVMLCQTSGRPRPPSSSLRPWGVSIFPVQEPRCSRKPTWRQEVRWAAKSSSDGGNGGGTGSGSGSGGGSGGGDGGGGGDEASNPAESKVFGWKGWQDRVAADPQFVYKVVIEQVIGVTSMLAGDLLTRPNFGLDELDYVFATLIVGSIINFAAVYLLAPVAPGVGGVTRVGVAQKVFGTYFLDSWGAPSGHMFQPGFGLASRAVNFAYKGAVFAIIGMGAGLIGTTLSNGLLVLRKRMNPDFKPQNEPPSIIGNSACWALQMGASANARYQILNGLDMVLQPLMPSALFRVYASVIRGANNVAGGMSFVTLAKVLGVQKVVKTALPAPTMKGKGKKKEKLIMRLPNE